MGDFKAWWHRRVYISYWISYWLPVALWYGSALRCQEQIQRISAPSRPEDARPLQWHDLAFLDRSYAYQLGGVSCAVPPWNRGFKFPCVKWKQHEAERPDLAGRKKMCWAQERSAERKGGDTESAKACWFGSQSDLEVQVFHGLVSLVFSMCLSQVSYWWPTWNWLCMLPGSLWAIPQKVQDTCGQW
jgi:hypothetical protein